MKQQINTAMLKSRFDLADVVRTYTRLKKVAHSELAGPCPVCGGTDRLHVNTRTQTWFCRNCTGAEQWNDVIAFIQHAESCDFRTAIGKLDQNALPQTEPRPQRELDQAPPKWQDPDWQVKAQRLHQAAQASLAMACAYLARRGITPETAQTWRLGYALDPSKYPQPSVVLPWLLPDGRVIALKYRRLQGDYRYYAHGNGMRLFGLHLFKKAHTLILCEGELNAISLWQACQGLDVAVLSVGSESGNIAAAQTIAAPFGRVIVWCDKADKARRLMDALGDRATGLQSPDGLDANDLLQRGTLLAFMRAVLGPLEAAPPLNPRYIAGTKRMLRHTEWSARHYLEVKQVPKDQHDAYIQAAQQAQEVQA